MRDEQLSVDTIPKGWFTASEVHLGSKNQTDLVVMGRGISLGPYSAGFWVLGQTAKGYDLVLATQAHHLALLDTRTNGLRDIETGLSTLNGSYADRFKFDGQRYQKTPQPQDAR
jgi:hypothetical protein